MKRLLSLLKSKKTSTFKEIKIIDSDIHSEINESLKLSETKSNLYDYNSIIDLLYSKNSLFNKSNNQIENTNFQQQKKNEALFLFNLKYLWII